MPCRMCLIKMVCKEPCDLYRDFQTQTREYFDVYMNDQGKVERGKSYHD